MLRPSSRYTPPAYSTAISRIRTREALILTAIVITFGVSAFLLALIYRSWRIARADVVTSDEADVAVGGAGSSIDDEESTEAEDGSGEDTEFEGRAEAKTS